jgi:hypothetical protein
MSAPSVETLFDEFALAYARGERPDVGAYLERASEGPERDDLATLLDRFLQAMPARAPSEEEVVLLQARLENEPPLLLLRVRRALTREAVVDALVGRLRLDPAKEEKVDGYYHRLETGLLDPKPVSRRVWDVLADVLEANVRALAGLRPEPLPEPATLYRRATGMELHERLVTSSHVGAVPEKPEQEPAEGPDEIDRLFTGSA